MRVCECVSTFRSPLLCLCVCLCVCVCICKCALVWVRKRKGKHSESDRFDSTSFLSWRHLLPSSNLSVYQAKMLSKRLLRQLDNPPATCTCTHFPLSSQHPFSQHPSQQPSPIINRKAHKHTQKTQTCFHLHTLPLSAVLSWGGVAGTHRGLRWEKGREKGRRHNNRVYHQTSTLPLLVIQTPSTRGPNVITQRNSHTLSCQFGFAPRFPKWSSCQILQSWLPVKKHKSMMFQKMQFLLI